MLKKTLWMAVTGSVCLAAHAESAELKAWGSSLASHPSVIEQMDLYRNGSSKLSSRYKTQTAQAVLRKMIDRADQKMTILQAGSALCQPSIQVEFTRPGSLGLQASQLTGVESDFESNLIRVEGVACVSGGSPEKAIQLFGSPEFRKRNMPEISECSRSGDSMCTVTASSIGNPEASFCTQVDETFKPTFSAFQGVLVSNASGYDPMYLTDVLATSYRSQDGNMVIHVQAFIRRNAIPSFLRGIAADTIKSRYQNILQSLKKELK